MRRENASYHMHFSSHGCFPAMLSSKLDFLLLESGRFLTCDAHIFSSLEGVKIVHYPAKENFTRPIIQNVHWEICISFSVFIFHRSSLFSCHRSGTSTSLVVYSLQSIWIFKWPFNFTKLYKLSVCWGEHFLMESQLALCPQWVHFTMVSWRFTITFCSLQKMLKWRKKGYSIPN